MDSNHHGLAPTAPSTLRVYQFRHGRAASGERSRARCGCFRPAPGTTVSNTCSYHPPSRSLIAVDIGKELTKRQQEIYDFITQVLGEVRLPADGARHRQGGRPGLVLDGARAPRRTSRRRACCGATRRSRARSSCSTARSARPRTRCARSCRRRGCRSSARSPPASRSSRRRTSRSTSRCRRSRAATRASTSCASAATR